MLEIIIKNKFEKDLKLISRQGKNKQLLDEIVGLLTEQKPLPPKNRDHKLQPTSKNLRECHIQPNWLLVYRVAGDTLELHRTGSHPDLGLA